MSNMAKRSFTGGEIAPELRARVDTVKYQTGVEIMRNMWVIRSSGTQNRPGTEFVSQIHKASTKARILPFVFNTDQSYVLELGNQYMRVLKNGAPVMSDTQRSIDSITNASPAVVTTTLSHSLSTGHIIYMSNPGGIDQLGSGYFEVAVLSGTTFSLKYLDGTPVDSSSMNSYIAGGYFDYPFVINTNVSENDLMKLKYVQSADVMTLVHELYPPQNLSRYAEDDWRFEDISFTPEVVGPSVNGYSVGLGTAFYNKYQVTAVSTDGEESVPGRIQIDSIVSITKASPAVVTLVTNLSVLGLINGDEVYFKEVTGMTEINGGPYIVSGASGSSFNVKKVDGTNLDSTSFGVHVGSSGKLECPYLRVGSSAAISISNYNHININHPTLGPGYSQSGVLEYNVYREQNGAYGFIGVARFDASKGYTAFDDLAYDPLTGETPPIEFDGFIGAGNYPSCINYIQSRLTLAGILNDPERLFISRVGNYYNFTSRSPTQDDDSINFAIAGKQVNEVRDMIDLGKFIVLTSGGEWLVGDGSALTPASISSKQQSANGISEVSPVLVDNSAIYVQARGTVVRDLAFNYEVDGYQGNDISLFASHLFEGYSIVDMAYQLTPNSIVWLVRNDGALLGLTYLREQQILGWHKHDLGGNGKVKSVCVVPEGGEDRLYLVVERTIDGESRRYVERMGSRIISDQKDMKFMDSSITYDGRNTDDSHTMTLTGGTLWDDTESLTLTSSTSFFKSTDTGNQIHLVDSDTLEVIRLSITGYTSGTVVTVTPNREVPVALRTSVSNWIRAVDTVYGLWHLEGCDVSVLGDGNVVSSPNNPDYPTVTVANASIEFDECYGVIHIGLPYISDLKPLEIDTDGAESMASKNKLVTEVGLKLYKTRGVFIGPKEPSDDSVDPLENMTEMKLNSRTDYDNPVELFTGSAEVKIRGEWSRGGQFFIRQVDPLPITILACIPNVMSKGKP